MKNTWGRMQGVRPCKPLYRFLDEGLSPEEALARLRKLYGVSEAKGKLLGRVASFEYPFLQSLPPRALAVYVGIPFCPTRCLYCSFPSHSLRELGQERGRFVAALLKEIEALAGEVSRLNYSVDSVYVGGGTPTALAPADLETVLTALKDSLPGPWQEFTVEAGRPETLTPEHLAVLRAAEMGRISINPQTRHDKTLALIGRAHSSQDIERAFREAREHFPVINMDLILGLPGETLADVAASTAWVVGLRPENITLHMFSPKRASRYRDEQDAWQGLLPDAATAAAMVQAANNQLEVAGYEPYYLYRQRNILGGQENVGWTRPGHACRYNMTMISERRTILGLGGGASSKFVKTDGTLVNLVNPKDVRVYISRIDELIAKKIALLSKHEGQ